MFSIGWQSSPLGGKVALVYGTQVNILPDSVENIRNNTTKSTRNSVLAFETHEDMIAHLNSEHMRQLSSVPCTLLNAMLTAKSRPPQEQQQQPAQHGDHDGTLSCQLCKDTYDTYSCHTHFIGHTRHTDSQPELCTWDLPT